jgi:membrane-associated phospholipid phosphatase
MAFWRAWVAVVISALAVTVLVSVHESREAEADLIRAVQSWPVPGTTVSRVVRALTTTEFCLVFGAVIVVVCWWASTGRMALTLAVLFTALPVVQAGLKQLVDRPRPEPELVRAGFSSPSFPAGHVMSPMVVYGALLYLGLFTGCWSKWPRLVAVCWATVLLATTGIVNIYLGVHWPTDVLGGYLWGLVLLLPAAGVMAREGLRAMSTGPSGENGRT